MIEELKMPKELLYEEFDNMTAIHEFNKEFKIDSYSWVKANPNRGTPLLDSDVNLYTDGSKQKRFQSGAGLCAFEIVKSDNRKFESWLIPANRSFYLETTTGISKKKTS